MKDYEIQARGLLLKKEMENKGVSIEEAKVLALEYVKERIDSLTEMINLWNNIKESIHKI